MTEARSRPREPHRTVTELARAATTPARIPRTRAWTAAGDQLVLRHCHAVNTEFADSLPFTEVRATAQSISRWIWRNFDEQRIGG